MNYLYLFLTLVCGLLYARPAAAQADQVLPVFGGYGGGRFVARCESGEILNGFELRTGDDVDAIRPICVAAYAPDVIGPRRPFSNSFGGTGGTVVPLLCPDHAPAIAGIDMWGEGAQTFIVNNVRLYCSVAKPNQPLTEYPSAVFDGPEIHPIDRIQKSHQQCPRGLVPVGITGRSGIWLDAFGLICGRLRLHPEKLPEIAKSIGRVGSPSARRPAIHICDAARDARARNSPAAPNLEAQCRAAPPPVPSATPQSAPAPAEITVVDLQSVMARGLALANNDPLAAELRRRLSEAAQRSGFDVGMGIWAGNTAPGPGKQRYRDVLPADAHYGFDVAAMFSLPRNKHSVLSNVGAAIAKADPIVAKARLAENDAFYWLGFDIASGIFGNRAAGAQGNKATGPGSLGIRSDLNTAGQRGFDASIALHLGRNYN